jgi:hypothetical protein
VLDYSLLYMFFSFTVGGGRGLDCARAVLNIFLQGV